MDFDEIVDVRGLKRLHQKRIRTQIVSTLDVVQFPVAAQYYNQKIFAMRLDAQPGQHAKSLHAPHLEVEQQNARQGKFLSIRKAPVAAQIGNRFISIGHVDDRVGHARVAQRSFGGQRVIGIILRQENDFGCIQARVQSSAVQRVPFECEKGLFPCNRQSEMG